jgi:gliding motility-associated-like protein
MDIYGNTMVVGANGDDVDGDFSGVAYVFEYINDSWEKVAVLKQSDGNAFDNFGSEVAISENFIAVTCSFKDSIYGDQRLFTDLGAVYIYKKGSTGWADAYEVQKLSPPEILDYKPRFGISLDLAERTLVISEHLTRATPSRGRLHIYELNEMNIWRHNSIIALPEEENINGFGKSISINDSVIVAGAGSFFFGIQSDSYAYVYEKDSNSWSSAKRTAILKADNQQKGSLFGYDVYLYGNRILVGAPGYTNNSQYSGRLYLFERGGQTWNEYNQLATFHSSLDEEREHLGFSVFMDEENIVSGATSGEYTNIGDTHNPGNVMVFRKIKGEWKDKTESQIILSHESTFGGKVGFYDNKIIVSAYADETEVGLQSGAVHIFPSINISVPEVACEKNDLMIELSAFPNGGIWSGQGIVNTSIGQFNANEAGPGIHTIKYTVNACTYSSELIKVLGDVNSIFDDESIQFCENDTFTLFPIIDEATYQWSFGLTENDIAVLKDSTNAKLTASQEGFYSLNVETPCAALYDTVYAESYELKIEELDPICLGDSVILNAFPTGGQWEGKGIVFNEGLFISNNAGLGNHEVLYSVPGCSYSDTFYVDVINEPQTKSYLDNHVYYCDDTISFSIEDISMTDTVHWHFYNNTDNSGRIKYNSNSFEIVSDGILIADIHNSCGSIMDTMKIEKIQIESPERYELCSQGEPITFEALPTGGSWYINQNKTNSVFSPGEYEIGTYNLLYQYSIDQCIYTDTTTLIINETPQITFDNSFFDYCQSNEFLLKPEMPSKHLSYEWFYNENSPEFNFGEIISTDNQIINPKSGFYLLNVNNGICTSQSGILEIQMNQLDTLFIPNVITPNNDGINDQFQIVAENVYDTELIIIDRYGKPVAEIRNKLKWENINVPSGVYFYSFSYRDLCYNKNKHAKGYLHVLK